MAPVPKSTGPGILRESGWVRVNPTTSDRQDCVIRMPTFGFGIESGEVARWHRKIGEVLVEGEDLVEITDDKVTMALPIGTWGETQGDPCTCWRISQRRHANSNHRRMEIDWRNVSDRHVPIVRDVLANARSERPGWILTAREEARQ